MEEQNKMEGYGCKCSCHGMGTEHCHMCQNMHGRGMPNPMEMSVKMWQKAFFEALMEYHKDAIKKKMAAAWGDTTDKAAQAVFDAMTKQWMGMAQGSAAEQEMRQKLAQLMSESRDR